MMLQANRQSGRWKQSCLLVVLAVTGWSLLSGCGPAPVKLAGDANDAALALNEVLEQWKLGKKIEDLKEEEPPIYARDADWEAGAILKAFEVKKESKPDGSNWQVQAILTMEGKGVPSKPTLVSYSVTLGPKAVNIQRRDQPE